MAQESALITTQKGWTDVKDGGWTAAITTPSVSARSFDDVVAVLPVITLDTNINSLQLRFEGSTNDHSLVFDLYAARDRDDEFTRIATLTCTVGQAQKGSATTLYVDTIALSNTAWPTNKICVVSPANNHQACVWVDSMGYSYFAVCPTTVNGTARVQHSGV